MDDDWFKLVFVMMWCVGAGMLFAIAGLIIWVLIKLGQYLSGL